MLLARPESRPDHPLGHGWTVGAALVHLAFWDRCLKLWLERWQRSGIAASLDADLLNETLLPLWTAIAPADAARLAVEAAEALDRWLESASADVLAGIRGLGRPYLLDRSLHRNQHLDEIEAALRPAADVGRP
jgi:hypothetical protein